MYGSRTAPTVSGPRLIRLRLNFISCSSAETSSINPIDRLWFIDVGRRFTPGSSMLDESYGQLCTNFYNIFISFTNLYIYFILVGPAQLDFTVGGNMSGPRRSA